ncbi:MAG: DUF364 domain-containing protein [Thermodesulfobacteriota bacterium]|nr:DUF364 domain-containing protein [Thermodesulfobacteriota bacterium]
MGIQRLQLQGGGIGLSYTPFEGKDSCSLIKNYNDYEGKPAIDLLEKIKCEDSIQRSMAVALINALNYNDAILLPEDKSNVMFERFGIGEGTRVAMVGYFSPLMKIFTKRKAILEIIDFSRGIGQKEVFFERLREWADVLIMTSTTILNNTTEEILINVGKDVKTVMLGPSTPMVGEAFEGLRVHLLAGMVPLEKDEALKAIRHGTGTPIIQKFCKKVYLDLPTVICPASSNNVC